MNHYTKNGVAAALCLMASLTASAYDFVADGIYYNILSEKDKTCEVTQGDEEYSGGHIIGNLYVMVTRVDEHETGDNYCVSVSKDFYETYMS